MMTDTETRVLRVEVSTPQAAMEAFADTWERAERGESLAPMEHIGFESLAELLAVLTPQRWELIRLVRQHGPLHTADLPALTGRAEEPLAQDLALLSELGIIEVYAGDQVRVPWDEIDLRVPLAA
jgi:predicted transcriptional regulator